MDIVHCKAAVGIINGVLVLYLFDVIFVVCIKLMDSVHCKAAVGIINGVLVLYLFDVIFVVCSCIRNLCKSVTSDFLSKAIRLLYSSNKTVLYE